MTFIFTITTKKVRVKKDLHWKHKTQYWCFLLQADQGFTLPSEHIQISCTTTLNEPINTKYAPLLHTTEALCDSYLNNKAWY